MIYKRQLKETIYSLFFLFTVLLGSCALTGNGSSIISGDHSIPIETNFNPPELIEVTATGENTVEFQFTEPVTVDGEFEFSPTGSGESFLLTVKEIEDDKTTVKLILNGNTLPGINYKGKVFFKDRSENIMGFLVTFYGYNPNLPEALINELRINGSATDPVPDFVEIYFITGGNPGGMTIFIGTKENPINTYTFPSMTVSAGDYALVHCFPENTSAGTPETEGKNTASGPGFSPYAFDFEMNNDNGLSGTNGMVTLYTSPGGNPIDGVIYTNRNGDPEEAKFGWTSSVYPLVESFAAGLFWDFKGDDPLPDFAVWSGNIKSAKRTLCRNSLSGDTDSKADWHTTPTNGWSPGYQNSDLVYSP